jgi:RNA polymerase-interacting CarD/CdnL/TRCF family regulator
MAGFKVGDVVVHWNFGLGKVVAIEVKNIHSREMLCYVVKIRELTIWVAADDPDTSSIRQPTSKDQFGQLFSILKSEGEPLPVDRFDRKLYLSERMKNGTLDSMCRAIRDILRFGKEKKLNDNDKSALERARNFLLNEWTLSLAVPQIQAQNELNQILSAV